MQYVHYWSLDNLKLTYCLYPIAKVGFRVSFLSPSIPAATIVTET